MNDSIDMLAAASSNEGTRYFVLPNGFCLVMSDVKRINEALKKYKSVALTCDNVADVYFITRRCLFGVQVYLLTDVVDGEMPTETVPGNLKLRVYDSNDNEVAYIHAGDAYLSDFVTEAELPFHLSNPRVELDASVVWGAFRFKGGTRLHARMAHFLPYGLNAYFQASPMGDCIIVHEPVYEEELELAGKKFLYITQPDIIDEILGTSLIETGFQLYDAPGAPSRYEILVTRGFKVRMQYGGYGQLNRKTGDRWVSVADALDNVVDVVATADNAMEWCRANIDSKYWSLFNKRVLRYLNTLNQNF